MTSGRILVVDDEPGVRSSLSAILVDEGYAVDAVESGEQCLDVVAQASYQAIFLDVWLPGQDGLETLKGLKRAGVDASVIMISGHATVETAVRATKMGAHDFVEKPLSLEKVVLTLRNALRARKLEQRNLRLKEELRRDVSLVGESAAIQRARERLEAAAPAAGGVLITGEKGVGKELAARLLHAKGPRAEEAFIEVQCALLPPERAVEELLGRASEPGGPAVRGKLELAHEGTLFLDDVEALAPEAQALLFRALESGRIDPQAGHGPLVVDVRPVAASTRDLPALVEAGQFDADLHAKLSVVPVFLPPLRSRPEDIPLLLDTYLQRFAREYARPTRRLEPDAMEVLLRYDWPGNVRELRNLAERLAILGSGRNIVAADLPFAPPREDSEAGRPPSLQEERAAFERRLIRDRLATLDGNVAKVAESLRIERSHLYRKMKVLGIRVERG